MHDTSVNKACGDETRSQERRLAQSAYHEGKVQGTGSIMWVQRFVEKSNVPLASWRSHKSRLP